jgi:hypothetical protein
MGNTSAIKEQFSTKALLFTGNSSLVVITQIDPKIYVPDGRDAATKAAARQQRALMQDEQQEFTSRR